MNATGIIKTIALMALTVLTIGCNSRTAFSEYRNVPLQGWDKDSVVCFDVNITDSMATYNVILSLRHTADYPYQNIWFFVQNETSGQNDTLEYYLADQRGRWLGNGFGDRKEMPCLLYEHVRFPHGGIYRYAVRQGMRQEWLRGVTEVGLIVEKEQ